MILNGSMLGSADSLNLCPTASYCVALAQLNRQQEGASDMSGAFYEDEILGSAACDNKLVPIRFPGQRDNMFLIVYRQDLPKESVSRE